MSILSDLVLPPWLKIAFKAIPFIAIAILAVALFTTRATLHEVRLTDKVLAAQQTAASALQEANNAKAQQAASESYAEKLQNVQPIILHSKETVREFAQTPAGAAPCLDAGRVSGIEKDRDALFGPATSSSSATSVPAVATGK